MSLTKIYKDRLNEYSFKCKKRLESECLNVIENYINSRIQFSRSVSTPEYQQKFFENLKFYFDDQKVLQRVNFNVIMNSWTVNFDADNTSSMFVKIKNLVLSLIKTDDMDQFLRALKLFYLNTSKRLYALAIDFVLSTLV